MGILSNHQCIAGIFPYIPNIFEDPHLWNPQNNIILFIYIHTYIEYNIIYIYSYTYVYNVLIYNIYIMSNIHIYILIINIKNIYIIYSSIHIYIICEYIINII